MTLKDGDQVWVTRKDGAYDCGWAIWIAPTRFHEGYFAAPCGVQYGPGFLKRILTWGPRHRSGYHHMAEQLIAEGAI